MLTILAELGYHALTYFSGVRVLIVVVANILLSEHLHHLRVILLHDAIVIDSVGLTLRCSLNKHVLQYAAQLSLHSLDAENHAAKLVDELL